MGHWTYAALLVGCLVVTAPLEVFLRVRVYARWRRVLLAMLPTFVVFVAWVLYAIGQGHWDYSAERTLGVRLPGGIPVEEVLFFVSDEKYTRVQTGKVEALIRKPIKELAETLDPAQFWRIHRATLVNARAIDGITRDSRGRQLVGVKGSGEKLEVSRSYAHLFKGM